MTRIGPAGWAYKDWWGVVYPAKKPRGFSEVSYLAQYFDTIEINVTFYRPLSAKTAVAWLQKIETHPRFRFTAKLWRGFTHDRNATATDEQEFKDGFAPMLEQGKLGALLMQFPWSFRNTPENRDYLARLCARFAEFPLVLEVRHAELERAGCARNAGTTEPGSCAISISPCSVSLSGPVRLLLQRLATFAFMGGITIAGGAIRNITANGTTIFTPSRSLIRGWIGSRRWSTRSRTPTWLLTIITSAKPL